MSFMHQEVKYRGYEPVLNWFPTDEQPRPSSTEANACVKRLLTKPKRSCLAVLSCTPDGLTCIDTNFNPPKTLMNHSVFEIAHCTVDATKPRLFTCIVGSKGSTTDFFCHVFKCNSKEQAKRIVRAVAAVCTAAYQQHKKKNLSPSPSTNRQPSLRQQQQPLPPTPSSPMEERVQAHMRKSMRRRSAPRNGQPNPRLTDSWFRPSMTRGEVNTILRAGHIGDFIIRESQSRPGDYAISVQTGQQIWTGLVVRTPGGFQLGERGGVTFDDLAELVAFYSQNRFMNDSNGYPLTLRLPDDTEYVTDAQPMRGSVRRPDWRQPSFRRAPPPFADLEDHDFHEEDEEGDEEEEEDFDDVDEHTAGPSFKDIMDGMVGMPDEEGEGDSSESEQDAFKPAVRRVELHEMSEQEAFEMFMNQGTIDLDEHGEFVHLDDMRAALAEADDGAEEEAGAGQGFDDDFVPGGDDDATAAAQEDEEMNGGDGGGDGRHADDDAFAVADKNNNSNNSTDAVNGFGDEEEAEEQGAEAQIQHLAQAIFEMVEQDDEGCLSGQGVRPVLLRSGLDINTLGSIWMEVDNERRGKIDFDQLCLILGMISQAQQGLEPDLATLDMAIDAPTIEDVEI
ncbi:hypothetical protein PTSG_02786 [Salpingoeca rosetta]|uniref:SH2 domain-containing protein n=1 Tax=Salpingoeca rosetta (strain ATCC 50818 / BSB-021) TaxID=946362 RepID=F2U3B3_SALR5|nr:uncharacterized protein PTSG_02786 [Salpingoeca rosetta]EGD82107.1 hypothetical protein PTSG_02786 [Salpingoeca rosetta]|eukprot:XP_004996290.1 hypothetical protein PTSG_02786 [Salpingoeca rosetta]